MFPKKLPKCCVCNVLPALADLKTLAPKAFCTRTLELCPERQWCLVISIWCKPSSCCNKKQKSTTHTHTSQKTAPTYKKCQLAWQPLVWMKGLLQSSTRTWALSHHHPDTPKQSCRHKNGSVEKCKVLEQQWKVLFLYQNWARSEASFSCTTSQQSMPSIFGASPFGRWIVTSLQTTPS